VKYQASRGGDRGHSGRGMYGLTTAVLVSLIDSDLGKGEAGVQREPVRNNVDLVHVIDVVSVALLAAVDGGGQTEAGNWNGRTIELMAAGADGNVDVVEGK